MMTFERSLFAVVFGRLEALHRCSPMTEV